jgi:uncharacterized membrane protein YeaQ/YmgE (transglycosylase-associated protein family)
MIVVRNGLGIVAGAVGWMFAFFTLAYALAFAWRDYALHGQAWFDAQRFEFTAAQGWLNVAFWLLAEIFAGWLAVAVARRREAGWVLATLIGAYMAYIHLYAAWDLIPAWYILAVAIPVVPAVLCGGWLAQGFARGPGPIARAAG